MADWTLVGRRISSAFALYDQTFAIVYPEPAFTIRGGGTYYVRCDRRGRAFGRLNRRERRVILEALSQEFGASTVTTRGQDLYLSVDPAEEIQLTFSIPPP